MAEISQYSYTVSPINILHKCITSVTVNEPIDTVTLAKVHDLLRFPQLLCTVLFLTQDPTQGSTLPSVVLSPEAPCGWDSFSGFLVSDFGSFKKSWSGALWDISQWGDV